MTPKTVDWTQISVAFKIIFTFQLFPNPSPKSARYVLPNSVDSRIVSHMYTNLIEIAPSVQELIFNTYTQICTIIIIFLSVNTFH